MIDQDISQRRLALVGSLEKVIEELGLSADQVSALDFNRYDLQEELRLSLARWSDRHRYDGETISPEAKLPTGFRLKPLELQVELLRLSLPQLQPGLWLQTYERQAPRRPGSEGWLAFSKWTALSDSYFQALEVALEVLAASRTFNNLCDREAAEDFLILPRTKAALQRLFSRQSGDIVALPVQTGSRHGCPSVRHAYEMLDDDEFGLDSIAGACLMLTHPERLTDYYHKGFDCLGNQIPPAPMNEVWQVPCFGFDNQRLEYDADVFDSTDPRFGPLTGYLNNF